MTARQWYEAAAAAGSVRAQNNLGMMMFEGRGGPPNPGMAAAWFRLAAANGSMAAASNLGICYEDGVGAYSPELKPPNALQYCPPSHPEEMSSAGSIYWSCVVCQPIRNWYGRLPRGAVGCAVAMCRAA